MEASENLRMREWRERAGGLRTEALARISPRSTLLRQSSFVRRASIPCQAANALGRFSSRMLYAAERGVVYGEQRHIVGKR